VGIVTGAGELSITACVNVVERARQSERPVRILYVSDFDPAGMSMPVAVARKIEHRLHAEALDLDIQVRPVVLTHQQCVQYALPRTPIRESERRGARFEQRYGEGATELDALEALRPGELRGILQREILRYHDSSLALRIREVAVPLEQEIADLNAATHAEFEPQVAKLRSSWAKIEKAVERWHRDAAIVWRAMSDALDEAAPDPDDVEWPEPEDGDEDPDPLFDSTRDYVEQIDRYKRHQGKPTERRHSRAKRPRSSPSPPR